MEKIVKLPQDFVFQSKYASGLFVVYSGKLKVNNDPKKPIEHIITLQYVDVYNPYGPCTSYIDMSPQEINKKFKSGEFYCVNEKEWTKIKQYLEKNLSDPKYPRKFKNDLFQTDIKY